MENNKNEQIKQPKKPKQPNTIDVSGRPKSRGAIGRDVTGSNNPLVANKKEILQKKRNKEKQQLKNKKDEEKDIEEILVEIIPEHMPIPKDHIKILATALKRTANYSKVRPSSDPQMLIEKEKSRETLDHTIECLPEQTVDVRDEKSLRSASVRYFEICRKNDRKPTLATYALSLGVSRATLLNYINGTTKLPRACFEIIKIGYDILNSQWEELFTNGQIRDVPGIFLAKANFGYKDSTEIVVRHEASLGRLDADDIASKYLDELEEVGEIEGGDKD